MESPGSAIMPTCAGPSRGSLCISLCRQVGHGDAHAAGLFLLELVNLSAPRLWTRYWVVIEPAWWMLECCLTPKEFEVVTSSLVSWKLVEQQYWFYKEEPHRFMRPTKSVLPHIRSGDARDDHARCFSFQTPRRRFLLGRSLSETGAASPTRCVIPS
jgi:hypothetical protein